MPFPLKPRPRGARKQSLLARSRDRIRPEGADRPPINHGYVRSFDGTKLFYSTEGKGRPLIFCYGLVCSSLHWTYQIDHFSRNYQTIWFDYRGHHNSETPGNLASLTLENSARDLGAVVDELGIKDAIFFGHSMGVNVVLEFYRQRPEVFAGMVLANGTSKRPLETLFRHNSMQAAFDLLRKVHRLSPKLVETFWKFQKGNPLARTLIGLGGFNPYLTAREDIELYVDQVADMDPAILLQLIESYSRYDATAWLHTIKTPTLLIAGESDKITPLEQQELMKQLIPTSRLKVIRHGSHCPQMDLPELVNLKIERFLEAISFAPESSRTTESASRSTAKPPAPGPRGSS